MNNVNKKFYAGVGSLETPDFTLNEMEKLGTMLEASGFTLRSGNAEGADQAFAQGVEDKAQIWLPWDSFQIEFQLNSKPAHTYITVKEDDISAFESVKEFHPNHKNLSLATTKLMACNFRQLVGKDGEANSKFMIVWTPDGLPLGGTAQAIRIAKSKRIQIINMFDNVNAQQVIDQISIWNDI